MSYRFVRNTVETYYNSYSIEINEQFCNKLKKYFTDYNDPIYAPITPEYVKWVLEDGCRSSVMDSLVEAEKDFVDRIYSYCDAEVYNGDLYTDESDIDEYRDYVEEV